MNDFESLIQELGSILGITLQAEQGFLCKIFIKDKVHLQIEYDESAKRILLLCFICEIPPGKFREDVLTAALKANYIDTSSGSFAFVDSTQTLILQLYLPTSTTAALLAPLSTQLADKAISWKDAIDQGNISTLAPSVSSSLPSPLNFS